MKRILRPHGVTFTSIDTTLVNAAASSRHSRRGDRGRLGIEAALLIASLIGLVALIPSRSIAGEVARRPPDLPASSRCRVEPGSSSRKRDEPSCLHHQPRLLETAEIL